MAESYVFNGYLKLGSKTLLVNNPEKVVKVEVGNSLGEPIAKVYYEGNAVSTLCASSKSIEIIDKNGERKYIFQNPSLIIPNDMKTYWTKEDGLGKEREARIAHSILCAKIEEEEAAMTPAEKAKRTKHLKKANKEYQALEVWRDTQRVEIQEAKKKFDSERATKEDKAKKVRWQEYQIAKAKKMYDHIVNDMAYLKDNKNKLVKESDGIYKNKSYFFYVTVDKEYNIVECQSVFNIFYNKVINLTEELKQLATDAITSQLIFNHYLKPVVVEAEELFTPDFGDDEGEDPTAWVNNLED